MTRTRKGAARRKAHNRVLKAAKGYRGGRRKLYRTAKETILRAGAYAYRHRRMKKRDFRKLWITRITAACQANGTRYSLFINGLTKANVTINRKMLSEVAIHDPEAFTQLVELAKSNATATPAAA